MFLVILFLTTIAPPRSLLQHHTYLVDSCSKEAYFQQESHHITKQVQFSKALNTLRILWFVSTPFDLRIILSIYEVCTNSMKNKISIIKDNQLHCMLLLTLFLEIVLRWFHPVHWDLVKSDWIWKGFQTVKMARPLVLICSIATKKTSTWVVLKEKRKVKGLWIFPP